mgnify:CR=1 FL=1
MWGTGSELTFLEALGGHRGTKPEVPIDLKKRLSLLEQYRRAMGLRWNWATIDVSMVREFVEDALIKTQRLLASGVTTIPNPNARK